MNPSDYYVRIIRWLSDNFIFYSGDNGSPDTVLHIHAGMAILFLARIVTRRSLGTPIPVLCVYAAELINEILDYLGHGQIMPDTASDFVNTVFWPTILFIGLRIRHAHSLTHADMRDISADGS